MFNTYIYKSPMGDITLASDGNCLVGLWLDTQKNDPDIPASELAPPVNSTGLTGTEDFARHGIEDFALRDGARWLSIYFTGRDPGFTPPLRIIGSDFKKTIADIMLEIPFGETVSYGQIAREAARRMGKARMSAQAVGGAVGRNSISIIVPCHRVIGSDGSLTGYGGGIDKKIRLLKNEGVLTAEMLSL